MRLLLHNGASGALEEFRSPAAPRCVLLWRWPADDGSLAAFRREAFRSCLSAALDYLGFEVGAASKPPADLVCSSQAVAGAGLRLAFSDEAGAAPAVDEILARGFDALDLRLFCLRSHYRRPLLFEWPALEDARGERQGLLEAARRLRGRAGVSAPNPTGLAGYKKRFRDALSADLDFPRAIGAVWDTLRPGALSPGSQLAALEEADRVLGLLRLG